LPVGATWTVAARSGAHRERAQAVARGKRIRWRGEGRMIGSFLVLLPDKHNGLTAIFQLFNVP
jgi:hypothetical protein